MFECKLDAANFAACSTPVAFSGLAEGSHTFAVRAVDVAGNIDASPATRTWTVDTSVPNTTITSGPSVTSSRDVVFAFSASETGALFECRLDGAVFAACSSPKSLVGLAVGSHTFEVRAKDAAANIDASPASRTWMVDGVVPDTTIVSGPSGSVAVRTASFAFSSTEAGSFECKLDGGAYGVCASPKAYSSLLSGSHTFSVRAIDAVGNVDASPATRTWIVDVTAPSTTLTAGPTGSVSATSASFAFCDGGGCHV